MYLFQKDVTSTIPKFVSSNAAAQTILWNGSNWYLDDQQTQTVLQAPNSVTMQLSQFVMPGQPAPSAPAYGNSTSVQAINAHGAIVGSYTDANNVIHGFYRDPQGDYRDVVVPGAHATWVQGISDDGRIMGVYQDATGEHGFEAHPMGFTLSDQSTHTGWSEPGMVYGGPVAGLQDQYVNLTHDNINVSANEAGVFIHSGSGDDALLASAGHNVLDGGTGSNFLTGGLDTDAFFVDARNLTGDVWSTIANFHPGDVAVLWGITAKNQTLWQTDQGAPHYTGLTLHTGAEPEQASLSFAGFNAGDLGRLQISYGHTADTNGIPGSEYMLITL